MRRNVSLLYFFLILIPLWAQQPEKHSLQFDQLPLEKVLQILSQKFNVRYSYLDTHVAAENITLIYLDYTLQQVHDAIQKQTNLEVLKIDDRYYSVVIRNTDDCEKIECLDEVIVRGLLTKGINKTTEKVIVYPQKVELLSGITDADVLQSLQQLPGVISSNETATGLHVRGGSIDQNLILWDGIRIYHPGHLFGMISGFNPNVVDKVNFYFKGTNPKFGERIASVIELQSTEKIANQTAMSFGLNGINVDVLLHTPLIRDKMSLQVSGRKSYTEWLQTPTFNQLAKKVFQNTDFKKFDSENQFRYQDYTLKLNYQPNQNNLFSLSTIWIDNYLDFTTLDEINTRKTDLMNIDNQGYSLHWKHYFTEHFSQNLLLFYSVYGFDYVKNQRYTNDDFEIFTKLNRIIDSGIELNFSHLINNQTSLEYGYQLLGNDISHAFTNANQDWSLILNQKHLYNISHVGYAQFKYNHSDWLLQAGTRFNFYANILSNSFEPRFSLQKTFSQYWLGHLTYEKKSQIMSQIQESVTNDLSLENYVWVLSNQEDYPIITGQQITGGITYKRNNWLLDADLYYKNTSGITSLTFGFFNRFDSEIHQGQEFTQGMDILIQKSTKDWRAWMTYSYQNSQNRFDNLNENQYFPTNSDIHHALNLSVFKKWNRFSMALGWNWHTGKPYSLLDEDNQVVSFNSHRLPPFHRMDVSGMYVFSNQNHWKGTVGFSIFNLYNQQNILSKEYQRQYSSLESTFNADYTTQEYTSLGFTPNLFLKFNF
jgi:hypothetical protein